MRSRFEYGPSEEAPKVELTQAQFDYIRQKPLANMDPLDIRAFQAEVGPLGIRLFETDTITVHVDGVPIEMGSRMYNFGEIIEIKPE